MRAAVLINPDGGSFDPEQHTPAALRRLFRTHGIDASVRLVSGDCIATAAEEARTAGVDVVVAGGGDGTLSAAAGVLAGGDVPLGVLPLGTANHFARDLGIPLSVEEAVRTLAEGRVQALDVGTINGHPFINNSSLGFYPSVVEERHRLQRRWPLPRSLATVLAGFRVFPRFPLLHLHIEADGRRTTCTTPFVFVGNYAYPMNFFTFGVPSRTSSRSLFLYFTPCSGRRCILRFLLRALFQDLRRVRGFETWQAAEITLACDVPSLRVFVDGELRTMTPPLRYRIWPEMLHVLAPTREDRG